jgi:Retrotransposon gag protein/Zinc knuckle
MTTRKQAASNAPAMDVDSRLDEMQSIIDGLQRRLDTMSTASPPPATRLEPRVNSPETFDGEHPSKLRNFLTQVRLVFKLQPSRYSTDTAKVQYVASFLRGTAFDWIQPQLEMDDPPAWLEDFSLFSAEINSTFGDPDILVTAEQNLRCLRQTSTVSTYIAQFRRHATPLGWNEKALMSQFRAGLQESIKDELSTRERPSNLNALIELVVNIDSRARERAFERAEAIKSSIHPRKKFFSVPVTSAITGSPRANPVERAPSLPPFLRLSEEQKDYRRKNHLCMYCGDPGHVARECPIRPARPTQATTAFASPRPPDNGSAQKK